MSFIVQSLDYSEVSRDSSVAKCSKFKEDPKHKDIVLLHRPMGSECITPVT